MGVVESILHHQLTHGLFDNEEQKVKGIAQLAVDKTFDSLTTLQQNVIKPLLAQLCGGVTDPGGFHNDCNLMLTGEALLEAYELCDDGESLECESCRSESSYYAYRRDTSEKE